MTAADRYRQALTDADRPQWCSCTRVRGGKTFTTWRYVFSDGSQYDERVPIARINTRRRVA
jgi:hypothetical protein